MKNLLIYISPTGSFGNPRPDLTVNDAGPLIKIQIDNSIALGWRKEDILLVTNFEYQYGPVKALVLNDVDFFERKPQVSKINAIVKLFEKGLIEKNELYWFHDLDAFQLLQITESELDIDKSDMGLAVCAGSPSKWYAGSVFFKPSAKDIFEHTMEIVNEKKSENKLLDEEEALTLITENNEDIKKRIKKLDGRYDFNIFDLVLYRNRFKTITQPIKIAHFHPYGNTKTKGFVKRPLDYFFGENFLQTPILTKELIEIFKSHGIV